MKTPLTSLKGYLQIMTLHPEDNSRNQALLTKATDQLSKLEELIDDLLDVSKITSGKLPLKFGLFDLVELPREVAEAFRLQQSTHELLIETGLPVLFVEADRLRIEQVLVNLITNGIRYSPKEEKLIISVANTKGPRS